MTLRLLTLCGCFTLAACFHREPLPLLGAVPDFTLTDQTGAAFAGSSLRGHVWVADFIYTNCPGPCPLMTKRMHRIQERLASEPAIRFVSFSVDPSRDTPAALTAYATRFHAAPERWTFLTGNPQTLDTLDWNVFKLGHLSTAFDHSTRFILIDRNSRIRAYYGMGQDQMLEQIAEDATALNKETT